MPQYETALYRLGTSTLNANSGLSGETEKKDYSEVANPADESPSKFKDARRITVEGGRSLARSSAEMDDPGQNSHKEDQKDIVDNNTGEAESSVPSSTISAGPVWTAAYESKQHVGLGELPKPAHNGGSEDETYSDPTPKTPRQEISPSRGPSDTATPQADEGSTSEIQSIMDQFDDGERTEVKADSTSENANASHLTVPIEHPPRRSSLEPLISRSSGASLGCTSTIGNKIITRSLISSSEKDYVSDTTASSPPARTSSLTKPAHIFSSDANSPPSPPSSTSMPTMPPPAPDPEPDLPFDFHRFLEQLRHRTADPVAKFLRSFLTEFGKKQWMVHEQVKIVNDFLSFITNKMAQCEVWRGISDPEFDNAKEGMEKLVMNRLYSQTFSPAISAPTQVQGDKGKKKSTENSVGLGRKGQHQEDIERDEILGQKVRIYGWVQEEHLDIPPVRDSGRRFLTLAQQGEPF